MLVGILSLCLLGTTAAAIHVLNSKADDKNFQIISKTAYKEIDRTFTGFIFLPEGKLVKEVPVKINGKQYSVTSAYRDNFIGTIEIDGEVVDISSTKDKTAAISDFDTENFYLALNPNPNAKNINGVVEYTTSVTISKDFTTVYGYTPNIMKNYGQGAFLKSNKDLKTPRE